MTARSWPSGEAGGETRVLARWKSALVIGEPVRILVVDSDFVLVHDLALAQVIKARRTH